MWSSLQIRPNLIASSAAQPPDIPMVYPSSWLGRCLLGRIFSMSGYIIYAILTSERSWKLTYHRNRTWNTWHGHMVPLHISEMAEKRLDPQLKLFGTCAIHRQVFRLAKPMICLEKPILQTLPPSANQASLHAAEIPVGYYNSESYNLCLPHSLADIDTDSSLPKPTNPLASYLLRVDILDQNGVPTHDYVGSSHLVSSSKQMNLLKMPSLVSI